MESTIFQQNHQIMKRNNENQEYVLNVEFKEDIQGILIAKNSRKTGVSMIFYECILFSIKVLDQMA